MSHEVDECVVPGGRPLGHPVTYNLQIVFGEQLGPCVAKIRLQCRHFIRCGMINAELEDAIGGGAHSIHGDPAAKATRPMPQTDHPLNSQTLAFQRLSFMVPPFSIARELNRSRPSSCS